MKNVYGKAGVLLAMDYGKLIKFSQTMWKSHMLWRSVMAKRLTLRTKSPEKEKYPQSRNRTPNIKVTDEHHLTH
jgi:hypothetical protein